MKKALKHNVRDMALIALFAALMSVAAFIRIPMPIGPALTLQTFIAILAGALLGPVCGALSMAVYMAIGLIGVPVFTSGGGFASILSKSFGYILGFILCAFLVGILTEKFIRPNPTFPKFMIAGLIGAFSIYLVGIPYFYLILKYVTHADASLSTVLVNSMLVFIPVDVLKAVFAASISRQLYAQVRRLRAT